jgi:hypothetical protein
MSIPTLAFVLLPILAAGCGSTPMMELDLSSNPDGAKVYLSRRGKKAYQGNFGPIKGNVKAEKLEEEFVLLGTSPLFYTSPLRETESDATVLGIGGKVVLKYKEGILRFKKPGFETVERYVRFLDGEVSIDVDMPRLTAPAAQ